MIVPVVVDAGAWVLSDTFRDLNTRTLTEVVIRTAVASRPLV
jgi:hypothetical protein